MLCDLFTSTSFRPVPPSLQRSGGTLWFLESVNSIPTAGTVGQLSHLEQELFSKMHASNPFLFHFIC